MKKFAGIGTKACFRHERTDGFIMRQKAGLAYVSIE
jgi:hypothetical protein